MLTAVLVAAAGVAGVTGAWSPCGFSMVETLAPAGYAGRVRTTAVACATFAVGALTGGVITFGGLSALGAAVGAGAPAVAAAVALAAALGEARGARIVPQVRRQVPESWRRRMPVPLAAGLYGVLLGLGFTTFILTFAVWALAGIAVALGDPALGAAIGLGFGVGRALPVVAMAPSGGGRAAAAMAERPRILRSLRALDAVALLACAAALIGAPAQAATTIATGLTDPSLDGPALALHRPGGAGELRGPTGVQPLPGAHPAIGEGRQAWIADGNTVVVNGVTSIPAPGADALAVNTGWVAWRSAGALWAASLQPGESFAMARQVTQPGAGRPALAANRVLFDFAGASRIDAMDLTSGELTTLRRRRRAQLRGPSAYGTKFAYVVATKRRQQVRIGTLVPRAVGRDRVVYGTVPTGRRDNEEQHGHEHAPGHHPDLWPRPRAGLAPTLTTTALGADAVYVTRLRQRAGAAPQAAVLRIAR